MNYIVSVVKDGNNETKTNGYVKFEDALTYFTVVMKDGKPDPTTWAMLNQYGERDMPVFTAEFLAYQGWEREVVDTITIVDNYLEEINNGR